MDVGLRLTVEVLRVRMGFTVPFFCESAVSRAIKDILSCRYGEPTTTAWRDQRVWRSLV